MSTKTSMAKYHVSVEAWQGMVVLDLQNQRVGVQMVFTNGSGPNPRNEIDHKRILK